MARKRKYAYITDPALKAAVVIEKFVSEAKENRGRWARKYESEIDKYTKNEDKQTFAALKLAGFYAGLSDPDVKNAIRAAISKAKDKQAEIVSSALPRAPTPAVSPEARTTAKKVAEILGTAAPAV